MKVNWSPENTNQETLSRYPAINTYPYFFVLDKDGKLLWGQPTGLLEEGSYNLQKVTAFLMKWAPPARILSHCEDNSHPRRAFRGELHGCEL